MIVTFDFSERVSYETNINNNFKPIDKVIMIIESFTTYILKITSRGNNKNIRNTPSQ